MRLLLLITSLVISSTLGNSTHANEKSSLSLQQYIETVDKTAVHFTGLMGYSKSYDEFIFLDSNRNRFGASIDAGREVREKIEQNCGISLSSSWSDYCEISGNGTVEIRGSDIYISLESLQAIKY